MAWLLILVRKQVVTLAFPYSPSRKHNKKTNLTFTFLPSLATKAKAYPTLLYTRTAQEQNAKTAPLAPPRFKRITPASI